MGFEQEIARCPGCSKGFHKRHVSEYLARYNHPQRKGQIQLVSRLCSCDYCKVTPYSEREK